MFPKKNIILIFIKNTDNLFSKKLAVPKRQTPKPKQTEYFTISNQNVNNRFNPRMSCNTRQEMKMQLPISILKKMRRYFCTVPSCSQFLATKREFLK
jgi:RNase P subunit RPR2